MDLAVGAIVEGKVTGITKFGAFVALPEGKSGMVHISEVASTFVNDIKDFLQEGQQVKVKIINIDTEVKDTDYIDAYIGSDNKAAGQLCGENLIQQNPDGGKIVILEALTQNSIVERITGFEEAIAGKGFEIVGRADVSGDLNEAREAANKIFAENKIDCVIHFAGLKAVGESVQKPIEYYRNNIDTTLTLLECMKEAGVKKFVFSSSATVYGEENDIPYIETMKRGSCSNPYGWTKVMMEEILEDAAKADEELTVVLLRYFNQSEHMNLEEWVKIHRVFLTT